VTAGPAARRRAAAGLLFGLAIAALGGACANHPEMGLPTVLPTSGPVARSFTTDIQPIFSAYCTAAGCHATNDVNTGSLDLTLGNSYLALLGPNGTGEPSAEVPAIVRVKPLDHNNSYLYQKLKGTAASGSQMPYGAPLADPTIQVVIDWIDQGALNN